MCSKTKQMSVLGFAVIMTGAIVATNTGSNETAAEPQPTAAITAQDAETTTSEAATYAIDGGHSSIIFKIMHAGVANFYGRFNEITGQFVYDEANPANCSFDITVPTASVDTNNTKRDNHLKSPDFFNTPEHPEFTFKSTKVERKDEKTLAVTGDINAHGVTKPITVDFVLTGMSESRRGVKAGMETTFTIKRTDFGMDTYVASGGLGDEVTFTIALEAVKQ